MKKLADMDSRCKHKWGRYRPDTTDGKDLVCADCGVELDILTGRPINKEVKK